MAAPHEEPAPLANASMGSVPMPDPTKLTTDLVEKGVASLRQLLEQADKAFADRLTNLENRTHPPTLTDLITIESRHTATLREAQVQAVRESMKLQFEAVSQQFVARDALTAQLAVANTTAVNAALAAQKEAAGKSESAVAKTIDQQSALSAEGLKSLAALIDNLKERIGALDGRSSVNIAGVTGRTEGRSDVWAWVVAAVATGALLYHLLVPAALPATPVYVTPAPAAPR